MMAAVQPFISGAISKTVNMPEEATVEDIEQIHIDSWKMGLKAVAIYRDNCKLAQPLAMGKKAGSGETVTDSADKAAVETVNDTFIVRGAVRRELPKIRSSKTFSFRVADSKGYATVGEYEDGTAGELFIHFAKHGSTLRGIMDAFAIAVSHGLQYGVPLKKYVNTFTSTSFAPAGITDDPEIRTASSLVDYIFRRLAISYLSFDDRLELGLASFEDMPDPEVQTSLLDDAATPLIAGAVTVKPIPTIPVMEEAPHKDTVVTQPTRQQGVSARKDDTAPMCYNCGNQTQRAGSCYVCNSCGSTTGCS